MAQINELDERVTVLEERLTADKEQWRELTSRVAILEFQLKLRKRPS
jgi:hypothetical protein